jgi:hypothetical protein
VQRDEGVQPRTCCSLACFCARVPASTSTAEISTPMKCGIAICEAAERKSATVARARSGYSGRARPSSRPTVAPRDLRCGSSPPSSCSASEALGFRRVARPC